MAQSQLVKLVGIAETIPDLVAEAKQRGAANVPFYDDYKKMLDGNQARYRVGLRREQPALEILRNVPHATST